MIRKGVGKAGQVVLEQRTASLPLCPSLSGEGAWRGGDPGKGRGGDGAI